MICRPGFRIPLSVSRRSSRARNLSTHISAHEKARNQEAVEHVQYQSNSNTRKYCHLAVTKPSQSILIVDDETANTTLVAEVMKNAGFAVSTASDGFKALAACKVRLPDLILLDVSMPLMSGVDVYNRLRAEEKTRYIPIIFLRNKAEALPEIDKYASDDQTVLVKPLEPTDVLTIVRTVLREKALRDELRKKEGQLKELQLTDPLTSFRNARFLHEFVMTELSQCRRYKHTMSMVILEPDQSKEIMKAHGQKGMDSILLQLAVILSRGNRKSDVLARSGGSEFAMVLPHTERQGAVEVAERLREAVQASTFTIGDQTIRITVSVGVCQYTTAMDDEGAVLTSHARTALNQAKSTGGNQTLIAE